MLAPQTIAETDHEPLDVAGGGLVVHRHARHHEELVRPDLEGGVAKFAARHAQREHLEHGREAENDESDRGLLDGVRMYETVVRLIDGEDATAEEEEERDDERPEVALLAVAERMPFGRGTRAAAQADVQEDLVQ